MKRILLVPITLVILTTAANASPVCIDNNTLDTYIALGAGGCTIGDKLFSNFGYNPTAINTPPPGASQVQVIGLPGDGVSNPGIEFSTTSWLVFAGQTIDGTITFTVSAPSGFLIEDASLTGVGRVQTGTGVGTVTENLMNGVTPIPGSPLFTDVAGTGSDARNFVAAGGTNLSTLNVSTTVHVQANTPGRVTISAVQENFSELASVPEPMESLLMGSGLLMLGLMWRKRATR